MFGQTMNPIIRSDGSPRFAMVSTLVGALFNIIFDPILIFGLKWGMMGAAVATIAGQIITALLSLWYLMRMKAVKLSRRSFHMRWDLIRRFLLPIFFGLDGVLYSMPVSDALTFIIAAFVIIRTLKELSAPQAM